MEYYKKVVTYEKEWDISAIYFGVILFFSSGLILFDLYFVDSKIYFVVISKMLLLIGLYMLGLYFLVTGWCNGKNVKYKKVKN